MASTVASYFQSTLRVGKTNTERPGSLVLSSCRLLVPLRRSRLAVLASRSAPVKPANRRLLGVQSLRKGKQLRHHQILPNSTASHLIHADPNSQPDHPEALLQLYGVYFCVCFVERTWRFGLPLLLALCAGGFKTVATFGFVSPVACSLCGPMVGRLLDQTSRQRGLTTVVLVQAFCVLSSVLLAFQICALDQSIVLHQSPLFTMLLGLSMLQRLASFAAEVAVERDWVAILSGKENVAALAKSNAMLRRMDLGCEFLGALAFGWLMTKFGHTAALLSIGSVTISLLPVSLTLIRQIAQMAPSAIVKGREREPGHGAQIASTHKQSTGNAVLAGFGLVQGAFTSAFLTWRLYLRQPILPASLAYIMLYFNAVMSPGGLMTAFLSQRGLDGTATAAFRSGCALMGFVGTWLCPKVIFKVGLLNAGILALGWLALTLGLAALIYITSLSGLPSIGITAFHLPLTIGGVPVMLCVFCFLIVVSRIGMWAFDMVDAQIFQMAVHPREASSVSAAEISLCNFAEVLMLGLATLACEPAMFGTLIMLSITAVSLSAFTYTVWVKHLKAHESMAEAMQVVNASV